MFNKIQNLYFKKLIFCLFIFSILFLFENKMAFSAIDVDVRNYSSSIKLSGSLPATTSISAIDAPMPISLFIIVRYTTEGGNTATYRYQNSSIAYCDSDSAAGALSWANRLLAGGATFSFSQISSGSSIPSYNSITAANVVGNSQIMCNAGLNAWVIGINEGDFIINPPVQPNPLSSCSLNSQNLNLTYSSTSLNVNGLTQNANLTVSCTTGTAQNYQLRLTGTNVTNGRLNFGNGVSAQVSLNGTQVSANGSGISLNGLTSSSIPVSASLVGSASVSGVTTANGILVLDAL